jgi:hypothetical protein
MYAEGLTASDTIQGTPIKASTVSEYLRAAADFVKIVGQRSECPMTDPKTGKQFTKITKLVKKYRRWEAMPNRQQPLTKKMVQDELLRTKGWDQDCKERAFLDWCVIGLHMGYRRCEWANEKTPKHMADFRRVEELEHKPIYQLLLDDMEFFNKDGERIREVTTCPPDKIGGVRFTVRFQKNGMHGQKVTHAANHTKQDFCCVRAAQRIQQRGIRLGLEGPNPASAYRANRNSKKPSFFHASAINTMLRKMAANTYKLAKADGLKYTGHSMRIGATVILYCGGAKDLEIQNRLRWRSLTFLDYLRDVPQSAVNHMHVLNTADVDSWV